MQMVAAGGVLKSLRASSRIFSRWRAFRALSSSAFNSGEDGRSGTGAGGAGIPHVPVLIVGAGPVGLVLSILLTKLGVECTVLEKRTSFSQHPQAHFINNRTMEIFRKLDGLAEDIQRLQPSIELWRRFIYCTALSGSVLGSVDHMQPQDCGKIPSPISVAHFSQYKLVNLLLEKLESFGYHVSHPDEIEGSMRQRNILMGHECVSIRSHDDGIRVGVSLLKEGKKEERMLSCDILIGCDGSRSSVRSLCNIAMKGERDLQKLVSVHFLSKDLGRYLLNERPGMLFFIFNPDAIGVLVAHDLNEGEFILQIPYYPPQQKFEDFSTKVCEEIILKLIGWKPVDLQVADIKPWTMHAEVAENYVSHNNRVILVGDAAHRFPPAGGFGMNTGIQDAHNLAWKISCMFSGIASPYIIQTYEMERKPIAISNTALSVRNYKAAMSIPAALGLDPTIANSVHQAINSSFGSLLPPGLQKTVLEGIFSIGRAQLSNLVLNENNPIGSSRLARLKKIFSEGKSLQLQFPAEDLGFSYQDGALLSEGKNYKMAEVSDAYKTRDSVPTIKPGSRLPHMKVRALKASSSKDLSSTLDLIPGDKVEFLLIIAPTKESYDLALDILSVSGKFRVPLKICIIWPQGSTDHVNGSKLALAPWKNYVDIEEVNSSSKSWWEICNLTTNGVILVRPDEHIAWMAESDAAKKNISADLERLFSHLGTRKDSK